jgi:hypothetical protein
MSRKRLAGLAVLAAALAVGVTVRQRWPHDQVVQYVLGDDASLVHRVDARWAEADKGDDWTREASFRYAGGKAPRIVTHEPRLPDGDYTVEIELAEDSGHRFVRRRVTLAGGVTSIDVAGVHR